MDVLSTKMAVCHKLTKRPFQWKRRALIIHSVSSIQEIGNQCLASKPIVSTDGNCGFKSKSFGSQVENLNNIRTAFQNRLIVPLRQNGKLPKDFKKTFKDLQKTSASFLEKSKEHAAFYEMSLDHSAIAKQHDLTGEPVLQFDVPH